MIVLIEAEYNSDRTIQISLWAEDKRIDERLKNFGWIWSPHRGEWRRL